MICPNCKEETKGIKINGKVFCSVCGEKIAHPTEEVAFSVNTDEKEPKPKKNKETTNPEPKIISKDGDDINVLNAELAALELIEEEAIKEEEAQEDAFLAELNEAGTEEKSKKASTSKTKEKPKIEKRTIIKHNRKRTDLKPENFLVVAGEPNPIATPELEFPTEMEITAASDETFQAPEKTTKPKKEPKKEHEEKQPKEEVREKTPKAEEKTEAPVAKTEIIEKKEPQEILPKTQKENILEDEVSYPLFEKGKVEELETKQKKKHKALTSFFEASVKKPTKAKKKQKNIKKKDHKILTRVAIAFAIIVPIAGLFAYVNLYWVNPKVVQQKAEKVVQFSYNKPTYLPAGYEIDQYTKGDSSMVEYHYTHLADKKRVLSIKIELTDKTDEEVFNEIVKKSNEQYLEFTKNDRKYWSLDEKKLIFKNDNLLYVISASDRISTDELLKIAEGLI